jgi:hypothetical protein
MLGFWLIQGQEVRKILFGASKAAIQQTMMMMMSLLPADNFLLAGDDER